MAEDDQRNLLEGKTLQECILTLWGNKASAASIMDILKIDEDTLSGVVPKNLWFGTTMDKCSKCNGRGYFLRVVPWAEDTLHQR